jgi:hypothetical protein
LKHEPLSELDHEFHQTFRNATTILERDSGATVYFKWTCENCLSRQTFDVPNTLYKLGECEECGHVTNIERRGCNYLLIVTRGGKQ